MSSPELTDEALGNEIYHAMQEMMVPVVEMFTGMIYADGEVDEGGVRSWIQLNNANNATSFRPWNV